MKKITKATLFLLAGQLLFLSGCNTVKENRQKAVFYPPSPAQPRLQYLTSFSAPKDLVGRGSAFRTFLLGEEQADEIAIAKPYGLCADASRLLVADTVANTVHELDFKKRTWETFQPTGAGKLTKVINLTVDPQGFRYVADPLRGEVVVYDSNGNFHHAVGKDRSMKPVGVLAEGGRLYIADIAHHQVHVLDLKTGKTLFTLPRHPDDKDGKLYSPTNLAVDGKGRIYVSDTGAFQVQQYDADGNYIRTIGGHGDGAGQFARNKGIAVDKANRLYVVDAASQTVQVFDEEGKLLLFFGESEGNPYPLVLPAGIAIDYTNLDYFQPYVDPRYKLEYLVFVANQYGPNKIAVYGFIQPRG